jgi:hypothetical protein
LVRTEPPYHAAARVPAHLFLQRVFPLLQWSLPPQRRLCF